MSLPTWLNSPAVYVVLLPLEDADDQVRASAWMAKAGRPPGSYEIMPTSDPRFGQAIAAFVRGMEEQKQVSNRTWLVDRASGLFRVEFAPPKSKGKARLRPLGRVEDRLLRVLFLRGMTPPGQ